ncbi:MAG: hypothetical protein RIT24_1241 [Planctomycetota bacterium]
MRKFKWRRQIGEPVFPRWELLDGFPARSRYAFEDVDPEVEIKRRRARWIVTLVLANGRPVESRWLGDVTSTGGHWAVWHNLDYTCAFAHVYDRKTRTSSRARVDFSRGTMKACLMVKPDDNGAASIPEHYSMQRWS